MSNQPILCGSGGGKSVTLGEPVSLRPTLRLMETFATSARLNLRTSEGAKLIDSHSRKHEADSASRECEETGSVALQGSLQARRLQDNLSSWPLTLGRLSEAGGFQEGRVLCLIRGAEQPAATPPGQTAGSLYLPHPRCGVASCGSWPDGGSLPRTSFPARRR